MMSFQHKLKINKEGFLIVKSELTRYQHLNLADALEKLRNLIREVERKQELEKKEMSPESIEKLRKRKEAAAMKRLIEKRSKSSTKEGRQAPKVDFQNVN